MSEFISRKAAVNAIVLARDKRVAEQPYGWEYEYAGFNSAILALPIPTEDVRPVVRGKWIDDGSGCVVCSECGEEHEWDMFRANFCDNCGADMREVLGDE